MSERASKETGRHERTAWRDPRRVLSVLTILCWTIGALSFVGEHIDVVGWTLLVVVVSLTLWLAALDHRAFGLSPLTRTDRLDAVRRRVLDRAGNLGFALIPMGLCLVFGSRAGFNMGGGEPLFPLPLRAGEVAALVLLSCVARGWMLGWVPVGAIEANDTPEERARPGASDRDGAPDHRVLQATPDPLDGDRSSGRH